MSEHAWFQENVAAYSASGLTSEERERLERHASGCAPCRKALAESRSLDLALDNLFAEARPEPGWENGILQSLRFAAPKRRSRWVQFAAGVAAAVLLGAVGAVMHGWMNEVVIRFPGQEVEATGSRFVDLVNGKVYHGMNLPIQRAQTSPPVEGHIREIAKDKSWTADHSRLATTFFDRDDAEVKGKATISDLTPTQNIPIGTEERLRDLNGLDLARIYGEKDRENTIEFYPPALALIIKDPSRTHTSITGGVVGGKTRREKAVDPIAKSRGESIAIDNIAKAMQTRTEQIARVEAGKPGKVDKDNEKKPDEKKPADSSKPEAKPADPKPGDPAPDPSNDSRKIIRTGEIEFEVDSFDAAVASVRELVGGVKGAFIATVNSDKLASGKMRGSIVVRLPPVSIDNFLLDLRKDLAKTGELKSQRIGSQDITKQFTDTEARLRAARTMEERFINIIKTGKGEIKDLIAAERELGVWRTKIEEMEGEIRYFANQVSLGTLTVLLTEKEIVVANIEPREVLKLQLATADVPGSYRKLHDAVAAAKGQVRAGQVNEPDRLNATGQLDFDIPSQSRAAIDKAIADAGAVVARTTVQAAVAETVTDRKLGYRLVLNSASSLPPREKISMAIGVKDVDKATASLLDMVKETKGMIHAGPNQQLDESGRATSMVLIDVPISSKDALVRKLKGLGDIRIQKATPNPQVADNDLAAAHIDVILASAAAIIPEGEGLWPQIRTSLFYSFKLLSWSLMFIILGLSVLLPWALLLWAGFKVVRRLRNRAAQSPV